MTRLKAESGRFLLAIGIFTACLAVDPYFSGCSSLSTPQGQATIAMAEQIANAAGTAAATTYGGPVAGQLASAGLDALGTVLNGYIGTKVPANIVKASPGVSGVGSAVAPLLAKTITTQDVSAVFTAAKIVKKK